MVSGIGEIMDKKILIGKIYKLLKIYEKEDFCNYSGYLRNLIAVLIGEDIDNFGYNIRLLRGLKELGCNVNHSDIRGIVLKITNNIDRNY